MFADELRKQQAEHSGIILSDKNIKNRLALDYFFDDWTSTEAKRKYNIAKLALKDYVKKSEARFGYVYYVRGMPGGAVVSENWYDLIQTRRGNAKFGITKDGSYEIVDVNSANVIKRPNATIDGFNCECNVMEEELSDDIWLKVVNRDVVFEEQEYIREKFTKVRFCKEICKKCEELAKIDGFSEAKFRFVKVKRTSTEDNNQYAKLMEGPLSELFGTVPSQTQIKERTYHSLVGYLAWNE